MQPMASIGAGIGHVQLRSMSFEAKGTFGHANRGQHADCLEQTNGDPDPPAEQRQVQQAQVSLPEQLQLLLAASGQQQLLCSTGAAQEVVPLD